MARDTSKITNARMDYANGAVRTGAVTNTLPTAAGSTLTGSWDDWGTISSDGINDSVGIDMTEVEDANGETVFTVKTKDTYSVKLKPLEMRACILEAMFGEDNVTADASGNVTAFKIAGDEPPALAWVFDYILADSRKMRVVLPKAKAKTIGDEVKKAADVMGREIEVTAFPDSSGVKAYFYFAAASS